MEIKVLNSNEKISIKNITYGARDDVRDDSIKSVTENQIQKITDGEIILRSSQSPRGDVKINDRPYVHSVERTKENLSHREEVRIEKVVEEKVIHKTSLMGPVGPKGDAGNIDDFEVADLLTLFRNNL